MPEPIESKSGLRPMEQTALWTFSSALTLLKGAPEYHVGDALDEFLLHSKDIILLPLPFSKVQSTLDSSAKEFTLRGVLFSEISKENVELAKTLADLLHIDPYEALRVAVQAQARVPETNKNVSKSDFHSRLPDDRAKTVENERLVFLASTLLKERRTVVEIAAECFNNRVNDRFSYTVRNLGKSLGVSEYCLGAISTLKTIVSELVQDRAGSPSGIPELDSLIYSEQLLYLVAMLKFLCDLLLTFDIKVEIVKTWFDFMKSTSFLLSLGPRVDHKETYTLLQALSTIVTLQVLDLENQFHQSSDSLYINSGEAFQFVNDVITNHGANTVTKYAWLIMLYKKSIILDEFLSSQSAFLSIVSLESTSSSIAFFSESLEDADVFAEISDLNKFLKFDNIFAVVLSNLLIVAMPLLTMTSKIASCVREVLSGAPNTMVEKFFENEEVRKAIVLARAKFPVSISPYLKLAAINGNFALHEFEELKSYMSVFNKDEFGMLYDIDLENTDLIKLSQMIDLYPPYEVNNKLSLVLKQDTKGKILTTGQDGKVIVTFLYKFNGWAFLGRVLQNISKSFDITDAEKVEMLLDMLELLVKTTEQNNLDDISLVLEYMSAYTDDSDIVEVLFRLFEQGLHNRSVDILEKLLLLFSNLMPVISNRIWPYLSKSSVLPNSGKESFLSILFGSIEMVSGDYSFTIALVKYVFSLAENCLSVQDDYPENSKSEILARFMEHLLLVFEGYTNCKFNDGFQKLELGVLILDVFRQTLETVHFLDASVPANEKPTKVFTKASKKILDAFLFTDSGYTRSASPILLMIDSLASSTNFYEARDVSGYYSNIWIHSALSFSRLLVSIRTSIMAPPSNLERELFSKLPQLVTIYSRAGSFRQVVLDLITALTDAKWEKEPMPSMLSHLGRGHSQIFLHSLATDLDNAFDDYGIKISIYDFLCSIMEANQQGLSVLFISGRDVFGEFTKSPKDESIRPVSLLSILKKNVNEIKYYPNAVTVHLLDAIALAFNSWTTARDDDSDAIFIDVLIAIMDGFSQPESITSSDDLISACYKHKLFAKIAEILSLVLFTTKNEKCKESIIRLLVAERFVQKLPALFTVKNYQTSLYDKVNLIFETSFPKYKLSQFSLSLQKRNRFGAGSVYELLLMDGLFQKDPNWKKVREQIVNSSANIQFYNAQIAVSKSLGALLTAFCRKAPTKLTSNYLEFVSKVLGLEVPKDSYTEGFSTQVYVERIELAFLITYTMNGVDSIKKSASVALDIIRGSADLLTSSEVGYLNVQTEKSVSYRSLLRLIYVALTIMKDDSDFVISRFSILRNLFDFVIAKGTKNIIIELQNDVYLSRTNKKHVSLNLADRLDDLRLILSILKCFIGLKISPSLQYDLAQSLKVNGTVETLQSLYSFSHLILVSDEPIFAQLSLMFIQLLLSVDTFADRFVSSGLFMVIRESVISQPVRNGGINIENAPQIHRNWTNGILPILVTTLARPGKKNEVLTTVRAFARQIDSCIDNWSKDSSTLQVSSAATWETTQILFIYRMLSEMTEAEISASPSKADMPMLPGLDTPQKREDFVDYVGNLLKHPKFLTSRIVPSTPEEAALIKAGDGAYQAFVRTLVTDIGELKEFFD